MDTQGAYTAFRPVTLGFNRREAAETLHVGKAAAKSVTSMYYVRTYIRTYTHTNANCLQ